MVVNTQHNMDIDQVKYNFRRKGGKSIIEHCPAFSPDGELLAVVVENTVRFYNISTGDCVRTLESESYSSDLIAIEFPPNENYNLYGCTDDGCITVWTWENGAVLREIELKIQKDEPMKVLSFNVLNSAECLVCIGYPSLNIVRMVSFSMRTGEVICEYAGTRPKFFDMVKVAIGTFQRDKFAALVNGSKMLFVQNLVKPHIREQIINHNSMRIIAVAAHNNGSLGITDALGRVTIMRGNFFDKRNKLAREQLHWHFLPPMAIAYSLEGGYVYTGGCEKVLVKWTLGNVAHKPSEKSFMPRLPGMVRFITANNMHVAITLSNNSIIVADSQMYAKCTILECGGLSPVMRAVGGSLVYCNRTGCLVMPGRVGHLQYYSTKTDKVLFNLDITQTNTLPSERYNLIPIDTEVTCADTKGRWLVTSEYRNDGINYTEEKLKFWECEHTNFTLNTCVNLSHGGCNVISISLNSKADFCVTAGTDQKFRIWKLNDISLTKKKKIAWSCVTACYYSTGTGLYLSHEILNRVKHHNYKPYKAEKHPYLRDETMENDVIQKLINLHKEHNLVDDSIIRLGMNTDERVEMGGVAISMDGSLIAAWFGCKLTLWDTHLCTLRTVLANPILRPKGNHVLFGNKNAAHFLVCTTENALVVWSLLSCTIKWYVKMRPVALAADVKTDKMAVVTDTNDVIIFTPHSSTPILKVDRLLDPETGVFRQMVFNSSQTGEMILYLMRNDSEIYSIEPSETSEGRLEAISWRNKPGSAFSAMLAKQDISAVKAATPQDSVADDGDDSSTAIAQLTSAASHMVPPVSLLSSAFLQQIAGHKQDDEEPEETREDPPMEVDSSSDGEPEITGPRISPKVIELWTPNYDAVKQKKLDKINKEPFIDLQSTSALFGI